MAEGKVKKVVLDGLEVVAAGVPIASSLAVLLDKIRTGQVIAELDAKIESVAESVMSHATQERVEELVNDPEFVGAFLRAGSAARTTQSQERVEWLRSGMVNGYVRDGFKDDRDYFMGAVERYTPLHVTVLQRYATRMFGFPQSTLSPYGRSPQADRERSVRQNLIADGFLYETTSVEDDRNAAISGRRPTPKMKTKRGITGLGRDFLAFIADPDESPDPTGTPGLEPDSSD